MGNVITVDSNTFDWEYTEEPHMSRRIEILGKHPQIKHLMTTNGDRKKVVIGIMVLLVHFGLAVLSELSNHAPFRFVLIYCVGTWTSTMILLLNHDAGHGTIFGPSHVWKNRLFGITMNLGLGVPLFSTFKKHHKLHHKHLADEILDSEYPSEFEAKYFPHNAIGKYMWLLAQPLVYGIRSPVLMVQRFRWEWDLEEVLNISIVAAFDVLMFSLGWPHMVNFLFSTTLMSSQTNMFGLWGNMTHTEFLPKRETASYYGWLNKIYFNFGYHMEHHDFPSVPSQHLPKIRQIAANYYEDCFELNGYVVAAIKFIFDDKMGVNSRLKRPNKHPEKYRWNHDSKRYRIQAVANDK